MTRSHPAEQHLLSTQLQPLASLRPGALPPRPPVRRLTAGHTCAAAVGPVNAMPGGRAGGQSPVTTKEGKRGQYRGPRATVWGAAPARSVLHLTRPPWGRPGRRSACQAGTLGTRGLL